MIYTPDAFRETDLQVLHGLIESYSFATLISTQPAEPTITHLPLLLERARGAMGTLIGHVARANPHWRVLQEQSSTTAIFHGPHAYVSPSWYGVHPSVPTWNYAVVHASGPVRLIHEAQALERIVRKLVQTFEESRPAPWRMDLPENFQGQMLGAIVGFEIEIVRLDGKFKLSQNRPLEDRQRVAAALETAEPADRELADLMRARVIRKR